MLNNKRIAVVLPAYNAATTLEMTYKEIPIEFVDDVILVDDASRDNTAEVARRLGIKTIVHEQNKGYGGNQKTCYKSALDLGADIVVMLHPDYQYTPKLITAMASMIAYGEFDAVLASRILGVGALQGGMPLYKYVANRFLTFFENLMLGHKLSEYHTGYRAFSREILEKLPLDANSDDFVFDNQMLAQIVWFGYRIGEVSCPTKYLEEASSINFRRSVIYGLGVLKTSILFRLNKAGLVFSKQTRSPAFPVITADFCRPIRMGSDAYLTRFSHRSLPQPWKIPAAIIPLRTMALPRSLPRTRMRQRLFRFQSSVTSWSSIIIYTATFASARATLGTASRYSSTNAFSSVTPLSFLVFQPSRLLRQSLSSHLVRASARLAGAAVKRLAGSARARQARELQAARYMAAYSAKESR